MLDAYFSQLIAQQNLAHAYAFVGLAYEEKSDLVRHILKELVNADFSDPDQVASLHARIDQGQFADFYQLSPNGRNIQVDQVRELKQWLSLSPVEVDFKLAVVDQAQLLNASSANAMLTFLEEPLDQVYIILFCQQFEDLLPTIQSRVQAIYFQEESGSTKQVKWLAAGIQTDHAALLARLSPQFDENFVAAYEANDFEKWLKQVHYYYKSLLLQDRRAFVQVETGLKPLINKRNDSLNYRRALLSADYLLLLNHALIMLMTNPDWADQQDLVGTYMLKSWLKEEQFSLQALFRMNRLILDLKEKIQANVNPQLAYEYLALAAGQPT